MTQKPRFSTFNKRFLFVGAVVLLITAFWSAHTHQYPSGPGGDDLVEHTPDRIYDGSVYRSGHVPVWNPYLFSGIGQPSVIQPGVFYPPNIVLYAFLSGVVAHNLMMIGHILMAFYFMRQFLKLHNLTNWAATLGALTLISGSVTICFIEAVPSSNARVWIIAAFYFLERWIQSRRIIFFLWMGACIALVLLAGWPQMVLLGGVYLLLYALMALADCPEKKQLIGGFLGAFLFSALLAMAQILPALELKKHSNLDVMTYGFFGTCAVPPVLFVQMLIPFLFGCGTGPFSIPWLGPLNLCVMQIYVGILPLMLAATGVLFWRKSRLVRFGAVAFVLSLLLAAATYTPVGHLLYRIPAYNFFRDHYYHFYFTTFALGILTAAAISELDRGTVSGLVRKRLSWIVPAGFVAAFVLVLAVRHSLFRILKAGPHAWWPGYEYQAYLSLKPSNPATIAALVVLLLSVIPFWLKMRAPSDRRVNWLIAIASVLVMGSYFMVIYAGPSSADPPGSDDAILERLRKLSSPASDRIYSAECCDRFLHIHNTEEIPVADIMGYGSLFPYPYSDLLNLHSGGRTDYWAELIINHRILSLLNVRYIIVTSDQLRHLQEFMPISPDRQAPALPIVTAQPNLLDPGQWQTIGMRATVAPALTFFGETNSISGVQQQGLALEANSLYELTFDYRSQQVDAPRYSIALGSGDSVRPTIVLPVVMSSQTSPYIMLYATGQRNQSATLKFSGDTPVQIELSNIALRRLASLPLPASNYNLVEHAGDMKLLENNDVLPRAFFVRTIHPIHQYGEARTALWDMSDKLDLRSTALVQDWPDKQGVELNAGEVRSLNYASGKVAVTASCEGKCFLVLTDRYSPEWKATIDGLPTPIYPTNAVVRGVLVPAGEHQVLFSYEPKYQTAAFVISGLAAVGLLLYTLLRSCGQVT